MFSNNDTSFSIGEAGEKISPVIKSKSLFSVKHLTDFVAKNYIKAMSSASCVCRKIRGFTLKDKINPIPVMNIFIKNISNLASKALRVFIKGNIKDHEIILPSGNKITGEMFLNFDLFKYTDTKNSTQIFWELNYAAQSIRISRIEYDNVDLVINNGNDDWIERLDTLNDWKKVSLLVLILYFDNKTELPQVIITHMVASAKIESKKTPAHIMKCRVVKAEDMPNYLSRYHFPPFANLTGYVNLRFIPTPTGEFSARLLTTYTNLSGLIRTVIELDLNKDNKSSMSFTCNSAIDGRTAGTKMKSIDSNSYTLLHPIFTFQLLRAASSVNTTSFDSHIYMLGYSYKAGSLLYKSKRPISVMSPLVDGAPIYPSTEGPLQYDMQFHDVNYHMLVEYNNPYVELMCSLAIYFNPFRTKRFLDAKKNEMCLNVAKHIVDREYLNSHLGLEYAFWQVILSSGCEGLNDSIEIGSASYSLEDSRKFFKDAFIPLLKEFFTSHRHDIKNNLFDIPIERLYRTIFKSLDDHYKTVIDEFSVYIKSLKASK